MVNIGGNAASALYEVPTHVLAGGIDFARVAAAGGERQIYGGDILSMAKAYGPGFLGQLDNAKRILTTGFTPEQLADPKKIRGAFSRWGGLNTAVEAPLRILGASDALFRGGAMAAHGTRVAMRQARAEGFSGPQVAGRAATILKNLEDYPELAKETADAAARQVYQERRPVLGGGNVGIENDVKEFATKQFLPFYQTPMNVTAQGVAMSPLGGVSTLQSALKARNMPTGTLAERSARGREIQLAEERAARALIGTGVLGAGIALGNAGHLTGAYPQDPTEASTLPQGWRPWSIKVDSPIDGNTYYVPMQNLNAAGFPMAMAAILTDPIHRGKTLADPDEQAQRRHGDRSLRAGQHVPAGIVRPGQHAARPEDLCAEDRRVAGVQLRAVLQPGPRVSAGGGCGDAQPARGLYRAVGSDGGQLPRRVWQRPASKDGRSATSERRPRPASRGRYRCATTSSATSRR